MATGPNKHRQQQGRKTTFKYKDHPAQGADRPISKQFYCNRFFFLF